MGPFREWSELRFHVQLLPLDHDPNALCELVWRSVGRLLRLRQKYRDFEHKSGGAALISETPDTFQSKIDQPQGTQGLNQPAKNWNSLKERNVILDRHDGRDQGTSL